MKKIYGLCLLLTIVITLPSCSKTDQQSGASLHDALVGRWRESSEVYDSNGNGIMDASEVVPPTEDFYFVFYADGTGYKIENGATTGNYNWSLVNNSQAIQFDYTTPSPAVLVLNVNDISSSALTLKSTAGGTEWILFTRQN